MDKDAVLELSYMSKCVGQNEQVVQAGGGNTSVKLNDTQMFVKSSGVQLTELNDEKGYSLVDYKLIADYLSSGKVLEQEEQQILSNALISGNKSSIETFLHALTNRYTIHTHPLGTSVYAVRPDGMSSLQEMFPDAIVVDYATPGIKLAEIFYKALKKNPKAKRIFLKNHGLVVSADTMKEALSLHNETVSIIDKSLGMDVSCMETGIRLFAALQDVQKGCIAYPADTPAVREVITKNGSSWDYSFTPDCVVYCGNKIANVSADNTVDDLREHRRRFGEIKAVLLGGHLFAVAENVRKARDIVCMLDFAAKIFLNGSGCTLSQEEKDFLLHWESEAYRTLLS